MDAEGNHRELTATLPPGARWLSILARAGSPAKGVRPRIGIGPRSASDAFPYLVLPIAADCSGQSAPLWPIPRLQVFRRQTGTPQQRSAGSRDWAPQDQRRVPSSGACPSARPEFQYDSPLRCYHWCLQHSLCRWTRQQNAGLPRGNSRRGKQPVNGGTIKFSHAATKISLGDIWGSLVTAS